MNTVVAPDSPELLNARQVQLMLAVDRSTVYRMAQDGRLPALRIGHRWRFPSDRLRDLIEGPMPTRPEAPPVPVPEPIGPRMQPVCRCQRSRVWRELPVASWG